MSTTARAVTIIPATAQLPFNPLTNTNRRRVAGYARVSTDQEEQLTSYAAQVDYYTRHIKSKPEWEFVEVYTDEGLSATSTKKRDGFNRMIADALNGKIDLIITKSVSRFARNTVDSLTAVRQLKEKGVEIYFEKENIYTFDSKGELLITIMSSLAQEESRSISENVTWGKRKKFADGKVSLPYRRFLGYQKGPEGIPAIEEGGAEIVRLIYRLCLYGKSPNFIASLLNSEGIPSPGGSTWRANAIVSILASEKYKGDAILQKRVTVDFLTKKQKLNEGEAPKYYVRNSHPAIIDPELFDLVQHEMKRRQQSGKWSNSANPFSGKIFCGECGESFGPKVWHSNSEYRRTVWQCNGKYKGKHSCPSPHLTESQIQSAFLAAFNARLDCKAEIFEAYDEILRILTDNSVFDIQTAELTSEREVILGLIQKMINENASVALNQEEYNKRYADLLHRYEIAGTQLAEIDETRRERNVKRTHITRFLKILTRQDDLVTEFDEELWYITADSINIYDDGRLVIKFRDGSEETVQEDKWRVAS